MGAHGYEINQNILFQDNQSAIHIKKGRIRALGTICTSIYVIYFLRTVLKATTCQFHNAAQSTCLYIFHKISTRIPVCENLWSDHGMETHRYPTDGNTLNQGLCWKCGQDRIKQRRNQIQSRYRGRIYGKKNVILRNILEIRDGTTQGRKYSMAINKKLMTYFWIYVVGIVQNRDGADTDVVMTIQ